MTIIITLLLSVTVIELIVCHFTLWWLMVLISRALFCLRRIGAVLPVKKLVIVEGISIAIMIIFHMIFSKGSMPWSRMLLTMLFDAVACSIMLWDNLFMVYDTIDVEDEEDT